MIHHVQLACPAGSEPALRSYYVGVLGLTEVQKPPILAARGGCWFAMADGSELHLGVEDDFRPARKAHPALVWPSLDLLAERLVAAGHEVRWATVDGRSASSRAEDEIPGLRRFHTDDAVGNRLEFLEAV